MKKFLLLLFLGCISSYGVIGPFPGGTSSGGGGSGVTTVGTFSGSSQTNGATISGSTITFGPGDNVNPGMVSTGAQSWNGIKTFLSAPIMSSLSSSQAVVTDGSKNLASLLYTSNNTNSSICSRDSNGNASFNNSVSTSTATLTSGQTITMSAGSARVQKTTGTSTATFNLPDATTLINGWTFEFNNNSTGTVTINNNGATTLNTVPSGSFALAICTDNTTVNGTWDFHFMLPPTDILPVANGGTGGVNGPEALQNLGAPSAPTSTTDGDIATWNGTTGSSLRDETKFSVNSTTGAVTMTPAAQSITNLMEINVANPTSLTRGIDMSGSMSSSANLTMIDLRPTIAFGASQNVTGLAVLPSNSNTFGGRYIGVDNEANAASSLTTDGVGINAGFPGATGGVSFVFNNNAAANTTSVGHLGEAYGVKSMGLRGYSRAAGGTGSRTLGVIGTAGQENSNINATGGYFLICQDATSSSCEANTNPGINSALVADNTNTSAGIFAARNNGSSLFSIDPGSVTIGQNGTTNQVLNINTANASAGAGTVTYTNTAPVAGLTLKYMQVIINGKTAYIPYLTQ